KEARETRFWLRLLADTELVSDKRLGPMKDECNELVAILTSIIKKIRSRDP
ncbi:MAG: four helix bundle protein, partial [Gammaproteobacteria bacterium]